MVHVCHVYSFLLRKLSLFQLKYFKAFYLSFVFGVKDKLLDMLTCCLLLVLLYRD